MYQYKKLSSRLTHTVFDSHLDMSLVQAYEIPLLGIPLSSFPSFVCCFVVTRKLYHFRTESQDFFELFCIFSHIIFPRTRSCLKRKCYRDTTEQKSHKLK